MSASVVPARVSHLQLITLFLLASLIAATMCQQCDNPSISIVERTSDAESETLPGVYSRLLPFGATSADVDLMVCFSDPVSFTLQRFVDNSNVGDRTVRLQGGAFSRVVTVNIDVSLVPADGIMLVTLSDSIPSLPFINSQLELRKPSFDPGTVALKSLANTGDQSVKLGITFSSILPGTLPTAQVFISPRPVGFESADLSLGDIELPSMVFPNSTLETAFQFIEDRSNIVAVTGTECVNRCRSSSTCWYASQTLGTNVCEIRIEKRNFEPPAPAHATKFMKGSTVTRLNRGWFRWSMFYVLTVFRSTAALQSIQLVSFLYPCWWRLGRRSIC